VLTRKRISSGILLSVPLSFLIPWGVYGVPASPKIHELHQPDGVVIEARQWGDEWLRGWETTDGYTIVKDKAGFWVYAVLGWGGELFPTAMNAADAPAPALAKYLRPSGIAVRQAAARRSAHFKVVPPTGTANVPVLLINFNDTAATNTAAEFEDLLFGDNPAIAVGPGSMKDYYEEISYGNFTVSSGPSGVAGWFTAANGHDYYGEPISRAAEAAKGAVLAADNELGMPSIAYLLPRTHRRIPTWRNST